MTSDHIGAPVERPARVLHLVSTFEIKTDTKWLHLLARHLDRSRVEMSVACFHGSGPMRDRFEALGVRTFNLKTRHELDPRAAIRAARLIRGGRFDVVHTHLLRADLYGGLGARIALTPAIVTTAYAIGDFRRARRRRSDRALDAICARLPTHVLAVSQAVADDWIERMGVPPERISVIHTGIDASPDPDPVRVAALRRAWDAPSTTPVVLTVSRLSHEKGIEVLIAAARIVRAVRQDVRFVIVGDGPKRAELEGTAERLGLSAIVRFVGFLDDVGTALSAADLFCLPSHSEGMPNALLEAMAAGRPICATAVGGVPEAIEDDRNGLLVRPGEPDALAGGLIRLMDDPTLARRLAGAAKQTAERRFSALRAAREYQNLYERLISVQGVYRGYLATADC